MKLPQQKVNQEVEGDIYFIGNWTNDNLNAQRSRSPQRNDGWPQAGCLYACINAVGMEAHGMDLDYLYDQVKQAVRLETDRPIVQESRLKTGVSVFNSFSCRQLTRHSSHAARSERRGASVGSS